MPIKPQPSGRSLSLKEADALTRITSVRKGFCERFYDRIKFANYAGLVDIHGTTIEILPKVDPNATPHSCRGMLLRLLRAAGSLPVSRHDRVHHRLRRMDLLDIFISLFFDEVAQLARGGLMRRYREHEDDIGVVRGKILEAQFTRNFNRLDRIACRFDDLTLDNHWNRVIKAALLRVRHWISSAENDRRWLELVLLFDEVGDVPLNELLIRPLVFDRQASRYSAAVRWAHIINQGMSPKIRSGDEEFAGLLFDMNALFERAISKVVRVQALEDPTIDVSLQKGAVYLGRVEPEGLPKVVQLRPDIILRRRGYPLSIADTKWKKLEPSAGGYLVPDEADVYQMHAYASYYQCDSLRLIYPWHEGLQDSRETVISLPATNSHRPKLTVVCVDLDRDWLAVKRGSTLVTSHPSAA